MTGNRQSLVVGRRRQDYSHRGGRRVSWKSTAKSLEVPSLVVTGNVVSDNDAKSIIDQVVNKFGKVDVLINTAGSMNAGAKTDEAEPSQWFQDFFGAPLVILMLMWNGQKIRRLFSGLTYSDIGDQCERDLQHLSLLHRSYWLQGDHHQLGVAGRIFPIPQHVFVRYKQARGYQIGRVPSYR